MADENKFIGKHYMLETTTEYVKKPPYQLEFYAGREDR